MRIAFDLDGVLADLDSAVERVATASRGASARGNAPVEAAHLWDTALATHNFWETLPEVEPGAIDRLARIAREHRWEVLFVTSRPPSAGDTTQRQTQRWLASHGFDLPSVYVIRGSRGALAAALELDVVVDDRPDNCLDVVTESDARAILVWRTEGRIPENARRLGIGRVASVQACLDLLVQAHDPEESPARFLETLRTLLGLDTRPTSVVPR